jgi:hypothetical protein
MWFVLFLAVTFLPLALDRRFDRLEKWALLACIFLGIVYCSRAWMLVLNLTERPLPGRRETACALWNWMFRGVRPENPYRVRATVALMLFGWLAPRRIPVASLRLGDTVEFDPRVPVRAAVVSRVRFAPDPAEDYAELDRPVRYCAAAVEFNTGREFRLILDEADAARLRNWAAARGIPVCDADGYRPYPAEPTSEAPTT